MTGATTATLLTALRGTDTPTAPIWLMRQAGRYLPEYRAIKEKHGFWEMVRTPELAAEVTLQPLSRFPLDAAIVFSDIMTPLPAMGADVEFSPAPVIAHKVRTASDLGRLRLPDAAAIAPFVAETIRLVRAASTVPVIGFAGAPLTLAAYLVQGSGSSDYADFRAWIHDEPRLAGQLLGALTEVTARYLTEQINAGAHAVQIFDSWAGIFDTSTYATFGVPYLQRLLARIGSQVPRIYIAVGASHLYPLIAQLAVEAVSVDWRLPLDRAREVLPGKTLQGNLDPTAMLAREDVVTQQARRVLRAGLGGPHVFNLGHGLLPSTPLDNVGRLVDAVHQYDRRHEGSAQ